MTSQLVIAIRFIPQTTPRTAYIPIGYIIYNEFFNVTACFVEVPFLKLFTRSFDNFSKSGKYPIIKWGVLSFRRCFWVESIKCCIIRMEPVNVPQCQEHLTIGFSYAVRVELHRIPWRSCSNHVPSCSVCSFTIEVVPRVDNITFRLRHFLTFSI